MSTDGDSSQRLSSALDEILARATGSPVAPNDDAAHTDEPPTDTYELPEIVPATADSPTIEPVREAPTEAPVAPVLPSRATSPGPAPTARPARAPTAEPAATVGPPTQTARPAAPTAPSTPATGWGDHMDAAPGPARPTGMRSAHRRPRVRRVTRVLRHIDPWSTFKVALLFSLVTYLVALTSGVLLWRVADSTGTLDNVERWFTQFGWETFELKGGEVFHNAWIIGLFGAVGLTGGLVLFATVFNLVSDIIGGVRLTVLEEEVVERTISSTRRYVVRQGPAAGGAAPAAQAWDVDDGDDDVAEATVDQSTVDHAAGDDVVATPDPAATQRIDVSETPAAPAADWSVDDD